MKYLLMMVILVCIGCEDSYKTPRNLNDRDVEIADCKNKCKPREMEKIHFMYGCLCKDGGAIPVEVTK